MSNAHTPLTTELDHALGSSLLAEAMLQWCPASQTEQRVLVDELLSHARASANILTNILERRAITVDTGGGEDICDASDVWGLADLTSTLIEIISVVRRRTCEAGEAAR
jgi:hypothetical protein